MAVLSSFQVEVWAKYGVAMVIVIIRFIVRLKMVGWRNFDGTDFWCTVSAIGFTIVSVCDYLLSTPGYPTIIPLTQEAAWQIPDEELPLYEKGSKLAHFSWSVYMCMIFSFKGVMLCLLKRVGVGIWDRQVLCATILVVLSWVAAILAHLCPCIPITKVWQVDPLPGVFCTTRPQNYYVAGVLNMLTDFIIMLIPLPMLWKLHIPIRRKIALVFLFCSGIFIIICSILRTYYSFSDISKITIAQSWADREGFVSMVVISTPGIWPLFRKCRWFHISSFRSDNSGTVFQDSGPRWELTHSRQGDNTQSSRTMTEFADDAYIEELPQSHHPAKHDPEALVSSTS